LDRAGEKGRGEENKNEKTGEGMKRKGMW